MRSPISEKTAYGRDRCPQRSGHGGQRIRERSKYKSAAGFFARWTSFAEKRNIRPLHFHRLLVLLSTLAGPLRRAVPTGADCIKTRGRFRRVLLWTALLLPFSQIILPGCALFYEMAKPERIRIRSSSALGEVYRDGAFVGKAPVTVRLDGARILGFRLEVDGFRTVNVPPQGQQSPHSKSPKLFDLGETLVLDPTTGTLFVAKGRPILEVEVHPPGPGVPPSMSRFNEMLVTTHPEGKLREILQLRRK
jgi:hypothetical protein